MLTPIKHLWFLADTVVRSTRSGSKAEVDSGQIFVGVGFRYLGAARHLIFDFSIALRFFYGRERRNTQIQTVKCGGRSWQIFNAIVSTLTFSSQYTWWEVTLSCQNTRFNNFASQSSSPLQSTQILWDTILLISLFPWMTLDILLLSHSGHLANSQSRSVSSSSDADSNMSFIDFRSMLSDFSCNNRKIVSTFHP